MSLAAASHWSVGQTEDQEANDRGARKARRPPMCDCNGPLQLRRLRVSDRADHVTVLKQADPERAAELMVSQVVAKDVTVGYRGRIPKFKEALCPLHSPGSAGAAQGDEA